MTWTRTLLAAGPGIFGIDRMALGCYKTGALKGLSSLFLWLTPIPYLWWGMDVGASALQDKYIFCDNAVLRPEVAKKIGKFFAHITGIVAAVAAAHQAQKMASKIPGMGKMASRIPGMANKIPGMGKMASKIPRMASRIPGMGKFMRGGGKENNYSLFSQNFILFLIIIFSLLKN